MNTEKFSKSALFDFSLLGFLNYKNIKKWQVLRRRLGKSPYLLYTKQFIAYTIYVRHDTCSGSFKNSGKKNVMFVNITNNVAYI